MSTTITILQILLGSLSLPLFSIHTIATDQIRFRVSNGNNICQMNDCMIV